MSAGKIEEAYLCWHLYLHDNESSLSDSLLQTAMIGAACGVASDSRSRLDDASLANSCRLFLQSVDSVLSEG